MRKTRRAISKSGENEYEQFLRSLRDDAQVAERQVLLRQLVSRTAAISGDDELADLATVGAYLFAHESLEGEKWEREMMRKFPNLDSSDLGRIYKYARKLYNKRLPNPRAQESIREYNKKYNLPPYRHLPYVPVDEQTARKIAEEYDKLPTGSVDPKTPEGQRALQSYAALKKEINQQFEHLPVEVEPWDSPGDPYQNSREMMLDVVDNGHMWVFAGGEDHPMLTREENFKFRAVHDYYTHAAHGFEFGPRGEENAWLAHRQMFSPKAIPALTNETRGQNSWVNYGPYGEHNRTNPKDTVFAPQKGYMIPEHYSRKETVPFRASRRSGSRVEAMRVHNLGGAKSSSVQFLAFRQDLWVGSYDKIEEISPGIIEKILAEHPRRDQILEHERYFPDNACDFVQDYIPDALCGYFDRKTKQINISSGPSVPSSPLIRKVLETLRARSVEQEYPDEKTQVYKKKDIRGDWDWKKPFYHGTSSEYFKGIVRLGLMPMPGQTNYEGIVHEDAVFLTPILNEAEHHAFHTARGKYDSRSGEYKKNFVPMVVVVSIPDPARIIPDYDVDLSAEATWYGHTNDPQSFYSVDSMKASKHGGLFGYQGRIPAKFIRSLFFYSFVDKKWMRLTPDKFAKAIRGVDNYGQDFWNNRLGYPESWLTR